MKKLAPAPRFSRPLWLLCLLTLLCLAPATTTLAQERVIRVARISLVEGEVNFQRFQDKRDEWFEATPNLPLNENDQVYTGANGRAEIQFTGGNLVRLGPNTNFKITQFNNATMQFALSIGTATFRIDNLDKRKLQTVDASQVDNDQPIYFEVDSPVVAVTFLREGSYRINVADDGTTETVVRHGAVEVFNRELGTIPVKEGRRIVVEGTDPSLYQVRKLEDKDDWDRWNERRDQELFARAGGPRYVPAYVPGSYDLDLYGDWFEAPGYGWVWSPRSVGYGWAPYRTGYWRWYSSYGWTWIGYEPWGWVPYHYGRWAYWSNRWCWVPQVSFGFSFGWSWSPALVAFYGYRGYGYRDGFSDGYRRGYRDGAYDWVGWVPLAPGEHPRRVEGNGREPLTVERANMLRNYTAPDGVSGVNGRDFEQARVVVRDVVREPTRTGTARGVDILPVKVDEVKPTSAETPRTVQIPRSSTGRDLNSAVVVRRAPPATDGQSSGGGPVGGLRPERQGDSGARPSREAPSRTTESKSSAEGVAPTTLENSLRPSRTPDFTPAERPVAPTRTGENRPKRAEGGSSAGENREESNPTTRGQGERRVEQVQPDAERQAPSRNVEPRRIERQESAPRNISPPPAPRPERQSQPAPERQSQPAPERQPQAAPERQSQPAPERSKESAPARESAPSRGVTPKKPDAQ